MSVHNLANLPSYLENVPTVSACEMAMTTGQEVGATELWVQNRASVMGSY